MTMAVCFNCGEIKFGAFVDCKKCNTKPQNHDDRAVSLFLTDHFFKMDTLNELLISRCKRAERKLKEHRKVLREKEKIIKDCFKAIHELNFDGPKNKKE